MCLHDHSFIHHSSMCLVFTQRLTLKVLTRRITRVMSGETVTEDREEEMAVASHSTDLERQFLVIYTDDRLYEGQYKIHITYIGNLNNVLQGFYRSSYKVGNTTRYKLLLLSL